VLAIDRASHMSNQLRRCRLLDGMLAAATTPATLRRLTQIAHVIDEVRPLLGRLGS